ncbi:Chorismate binding domain-containing protein [Alkalidesulfovibrio alkalitolerans DSM 16529]|uniref:Chorismate binding domain-containing protein n=1 Tax=Alkalidesulfovibrio alkalitolerans DSM 16529 TaxID=1121439 RepID=S7T788_9BACT|nr:anthranilate synthase component I family protein [Alkalidesulfovibrio alkalitolerans]EPR32977.1 Chorismate binding domain-containing protein [Alkalidesulfovibrio alkalitolerans DSM 16529]
MRPIRLKQRARFLPADIQTPISLYLGLVGEGPGILLESAEVDGRLGRHSLIAWDFRLILSCKEGRMEVLAGDTRVAACNRLHGENYLDGLRRAMQGIVIEPPDEALDLPPITRSLIGYFGYGMAGLFEEKIAPLVPPEQAEGVMVLPGHVVLYDHLHHRCCHLTWEADEAAPPAFDQARVTRPAKAPVVGEIAMRPGPERFMDNVRAAKEMIRQGECIQVVVANRFEAPFSGDPFTLYRRLRQVNPSPYMFYMRLPEITLAGSSPELLVKCQGGLLETRPIAGTRPRGETPAEDEALALDLLADPKERAEHVMLVDLGRNDLGRIAAPGTVRVEQFMNVERFSHVMHLTSYVEATARKDVDALDVLASTFPAGTLSGAPKVRAMEIIADLENLPRGPYGGAVGWLGLDEGRVDLDTGILIRTLWVRNGTVSWQAGAGIVHDSVPEKEWDEVNNKLRAVRKILEGGGTGDVFAD